MKAMVEPLPFVPATWIVGGSCRSGWPSAARMRHMRSSDRSIRFGCNAVSRATMDSMGVMSWSFQATPLGTARRVLAVRARAEGSTSAGGGERQFVDGGLRARLAQQPAQICKRGPQVTAVDDHVDHAMVLEIFRPLKAVGQLLADGLLDDARPGKTDERARFRNMDVAEHGIGRGDAAGGRIGEHDDVGPARLAQHLHRQ